jgi:hypothetical protein
MHVTIERIRKGRPADANERTELARHVDALGDHFVAEEIGCAVGTLCRYLAGLDCYGTTHAAVTAYLIRSRSAA